MRHLLPLALVAACAAPDPGTVSSMNYAMQPVDPKCALAAVRDTEGFAVGPLARDGNGHRFTAVFNDDLPVTVIVRPGSQSASEISAFGRLDPEASPLDRIEMDYAVRAADEAVYRACTEDGRTYGDDVVIEAE